MKKNIKQIINGKKQDVRTYKKRLAELEKIYGVDTSVIKDVKKSHLLFEDKIKIAQYMREFVDDKTAQDIASCNQHFTTVDGVQYNFNNFENGERFEGNSKVKHIPTYHCGNRFCPFCSGIESRKKADKILKLMALDKAFYNHQLALGTLTVENLRDVKSLKKLIRDGNAVINSFGKVFNCAGSIKKIEMTYNKKRKDFHLHFHIIMAFTQHDFKNNYMGKKKFAQFWCTQMDKKGFTANVKAQNLQYINEDNYIKSAKEIAKYEAKSDDLANNGKDVFDVFYKVLAGRQTLTTSGCFYNWVSLINEDDWHIVDTIADLVALNRPQFNEWLGAQTTEWRTDLNKYDDLRKLSDEEFNNKILPFIKNENKRNYYLDYRYERQYETRFGKKEKIVVSKNLSDKLYISKCKSKEYGKKLEKGKERYRVAKAYVDKPKVEKKVSNLEKRITVYDKKIAGNKLSEKQLEEIEKKKRSAERNVRRYKGQLADMNALITSAKLEDGLEFENIIEQYKKNSSAYYRYTSRIEKLEKLQKLAEWLDRNLENILLEMIDFKAMKKMADDGENVYFRFNQSVNFVVSSDDKKIGFNIDNIEFDNFVKLFLICLNWRQLDFNFSENEFLGFSDGFKKDFETLKKLIIQLDEKDCKKIIKEELSNLRHRAVYSLGAPKALEPNIGEFTGDLGHYVGIEIDDNLSI